MVSLLGRLINECRDTQILTLASPFALVDVARGLISGSHFALNIHNTPRPTTNQNYDLHKFCNIELMNEAQFFILLGILNVEQRAIYDDLMYLKKIHSNDPIHLFLVDGAGTNKTFILQIIVQELLHFYNSDL